MICLLTLLLSSLAAVTAQDHRQPASIQTEHAYKDGNVLKIPLNETSTDELLDKWLNQAVSGLMAAVASGRLDQLDSFEREDVHRCSKQAHSVPEHARCVVKVLDNTRHIKRRPKTIKKKKVNAAQPVRAAEKPVSYLKKKPTKTAKTTHIRQHKPVVYSKYRKYAKPTKKEDWVGSFRLARAKRSIQVVNRSSYDIYTPDSDTFISKIIRQMTKTVRKFKNKEGTESWRSAVDRIKLLGDEAKEQKRRRNALKKRLRMMMDNTPNEMQDPRKPLALKKLLMEDEALSMKKQLADEKREEVRVPMKVVRESIKLALMISGKNVSDFDKKTLKLVSPRFMSLVPDQDENELFNLLSPSLFSLHQEGNEIENTFSLPQLMKQLPNKDQEAWLDFIVEAAGVTDAVDMTEKKQREMKDKEMRALDGTPLYFTKENVTDKFGDIERRKIETFEKLDKSYTKRQKDDLDTQGFSMLNTEQLETLYGPDSPYNKSDSLRLFRNLRRMHDDPHHLVEKDIRLMAEAQKFQMRREKEIVLSPFVLTSLNLVGATLSTPIILSPLVLSPITLSPVVLGPIILSPWVFVPLILSPRVLAPLILNPLVFSPIVLSPLVLHPLILVPGVFNPIVLSPMVLSPLILSPQVFTPVILSPMVLNPLILNPMAGSPLVLSPFVLSPIICSPQYLFAVVLSPYALSPLISSKLIASEVILSPSWAS
ncbi:hypothetical protein Q1695_012513 [Nippostrongylus brasiliensis]|nr:hypothetical protein Q1695_012513 [Nippostrongylus brasiliensis]